MSFITSLRSDLQYDVRNRDSLLSIPKDRIVHISKLNHYRDDLIRTAFQIGLSSIFTVAQSYFKIFPYFAPVVFTTVKTYQYFRPSKAEGETLEDCKKRIELDDSVILKDRKLHVIDVIQKILLKLPKKISPRISFHSNNFEDSYDYRKDLISISENTLKGDLAALEAVTAHELGHCYNMDSLYSNVVGAVSGCFNCLASSFGNPFLYFSVDMAGAYINVLHSAFREKEADRFSIVMLENGKEKNIRCLWNEVKTRLMVYDNNISDVDQIYLGAAGTRGGILDRHPTEFQRLTYALQYKTPQKTNHFKELFRFLTVPFYGDPKLIIESKDLLDKTTGDSKVLV